MSHSRRFHGRRGIKNDVFDVILVSGHPPGHPQRPLEARKEPRADPGGGPASILDVFSLPFGSSADPQGTTFGVLFGIFLAFLSLFRRFLSRALFGVVFGWFRDLPDLENMAKPQ